MHVIKTYYNNVCYDKNKYWQVKTSRPQAGSGYRRLVKLGEAPLLIRRLGAWPGR
jgi:hypothetical protein